MQVRRDPLRPIRLLHFAAALCLASLTSPVIQIGYVYVLLLGRMHT